jgi:hypothetical protein
MAESDDPKPVDLGHHEEVESGRTSDMEDETGGGATERRHTQISERVQSERVNTR